MKMPGMGGIEFLRELRADSQLKDSVVFTLATFLRDEDKALVKQHSVARHLIKGDIGADGSNLFELLQEYWHVAQE